MSSTTPTIGGPDHDVTVHVANDGRLPPVGPYVRDMWFRRRLALHMARSNLKASNADTVFGQLWHVINPLLLGLVYFLMITVLRGGDSDMQYLVHLLGGLFLFFYVRDAMGTGSTSVVAGGALLLNTAFPRAILPLATTMAATFNYLPTFLVYLAFHFAAGYGLYWTMLLLPALWAVLAVFAFGMAMLSATATVYFRDTSSFLPYALRIWMYLSPVLLTYDEIVELVAKVLNGGGSVADGNIPESTLELASRLVYLNPMTGFLQAWNALTLGRLPSFTDVWTMVLWAVLAVVIGGWFFLTREREFAFRV
ncbi:ABC transporter permease [Salsipaludibacter albus]|uniref:ABC transporter permease n=1 Tax=Salsipaludibacter albus TaxID=2849650 RepID=UPI001EE3FE3E|nr:ABC transporter permease [Salsipaludibacter albus]MBY5162519.1 ABC transporter permease [Salsipaludibacter albus]